MHSRWQVRVTGGPADHLTGRSGVTPIPDVPGRARLLLLRANRVVSSIHPVRRFNLNNRTAALGILGMWLKRRRAAPTLAGQTGQHRWPDGR